VQANFLDEESKWIKGFRGIDTFDIIMGNPPYQKQIAADKTRHIWDLFVANSINKYLNPDGFLVFVHPGGWRSPFGEFRYIYDLFIERKMTFLSINTVDTGRKVFNGANTDFDYYVLQNTRDSSSTTIVNDIHDKEHVVDLNNLPFVPGGMFYKFERLISKTDKNRVRVIYDRSMYGSDKANMSKTPDEKFKYPCVYTITLKDGLKLMYSSEKKGMFDIPKVIWSNGAPIPLVDKTGKYGLTQFAYAIQDNVENLDDIKAAMDHPDFIHLMNHCQFGTTHKYNHKVISLFKKDFYKHFQDKKQNKVGGATRRRRTFRTKTKRRRILRIKV
jgi:hypothetical protein